MELRCPRSDCGRKWDYKGNRKFYTSCPEFDPDKKTRFD